MKENFKKKNAKNIRQVRNYSGEILENNDAIVE